MPKSSDPGRVGRLASAFGSALTKRSEKFNNRAAQQRAQWLVEKNKGNVSAAAREAGIARRTMRDLVAGKTKSVKPENERKLVAAERQRLVPPGRIKRVHKATAPALGKTRPERPTGGFTMTATVKISSDVRTRPLNVGGHLPPGRLDPLVNAYLSGDDARYQQELHDVMGEYFHTDNYEILDIEEISIDPWSD